MATDDVWEEEVVWPVVTIGRRRTLGRCLLGVSVLTGGLAVLGSCLPWTYYFSGDGNPITISGLDRSEWGLWTLMLGVALIVAGLVCPLLVSKFRSSLIVVPAAGGLALGAESCVRQVWIQTDTLPPDPQAGLALVVAAYSLAMAAAVLIWSLDWRSDGLALAIPDGNGRRRTTESADTSLLGP
jgi:hypothetical protein